MRKRTGNSKRPSKVSAGDDVSRSPRRSRSRVAPSLEEKPAPVPETAMLPPDREQRAKPRQKIKYRTKYHPAIAKAICRMIASGMTLKEVCRRHNIPVTEATVRGWDIDDMGGFSALYRRARQLQAEARADELIEISDDGRNDWMLKRGGYVVDKEAVDRSKLRIDTRKWLMERDLPKRFGSKVTATHEAGESITDLWKHVTQLHKVGVPANG